MKLKRERPQLISLAPNIPPGEALMADTLKDIGIDYKSASTEPGVVRAILAEVTPPFCLQALSPHGRDSSII